MRIIYVPRLLKKSSKCTYYVYSLIVLQLEKCEKSDQKKKKKNNKKNKNKKKKKHTHTHTNDLVQNAE